MGGAVASVLGISTSKPDTSAYDRQLAEQRAATEKKEKEAAAKQAEIDAANARRQELSLINTSAAGDTNTSKVKRKTLLGE